MSRAELVAVPEITAGIHTIKCCACEYETTAVFPEECLILLVKILEHIQQHGITIPQFLVEPH